MTYKQFRDQSGQVEWIGISSASRAPIQGVESITVNKGTGIDGEHHRGRQVTLIQREHLNVVAALLDREAIDPRLLRRNIVVSGINLQALTGVEFQIGTVRLLGKSDCVPCERMEENLGAGGYVAMVGHGGITAKVIEGGQIKIGDHVHAITSD